MALPNIYPIFDLLERVKGLALQDHSYRIFMTWGNSRLSERRFSEGLSLMLYQKPEALNLTSNTNPK